MSLRGIEADPFGQYAVLTDCIWVQKLARAIGLPYLPQHLHEILFFCGFYLFIYFLTGPVLRRITRFYSAQNPETRSGIATHITSEVNALLLLALSYPLFGDPALNSLVSYTPYAGFVAAAASGYFLYDILITLFWFEDVGVGFALHAVAALFVFMQGNRPFLHNYSAPFIWFEASTTFVNIHWLATTIPGLIGSRVQLVNGVLLILVFLVCRVISGPYNGYLLFKEAMFEPLPGVSYWVVLVILLCYTVLTALNLYWFAIMVKVAFGVLFGGENIHKNEELLFNKEAEKIQKASESEIKIIAKNIRRRKV